MSDSDRVQLAFVKESTYGITPASALTILRATSESFGLTTETVESEEIRKDRVTADVARTNVSSQGDLGFEFHYGTYDTLLEGMLHTDATWSAEDTTAATVDIVASSGTISETDQFPTASYLPGRWVYSQGWANAGNNGFFKIQTNADADTITVEPKAGMVNEVNTGTVTLCSEIANGTAQASYSVEKDFVDLNSPNVMAGFTGMVPNSFDLSASAQGRVTGSFNFLGKDMGMVSSTIGTGSAVAANSNSIYNTVDHVKDLHEGQSILSSLGFTLSMTNNLRQRQIIGSLGAESMGSGFISITGTCQRYFQSADLINKYLDYTASSVAFMMHSSSGGGYVFELPAVNFTNGQIVAGGRGQDVIADMAFTAKAHATEVNGSSVPVMIRISRVAA